MDLKILRRLKGVELQYLREGLFRQLFVSVELKSEGGCRLSRSSTTVAANVEETEINDIAIKMCKMKFFTKMDAIEEICRGKREISIYQTNIQTVSRQFTAVSINTNPNLFSFILFFSYIILKFIFYLLHWPNGQCNKILHRS